MKIVADLRSMDVAGPSAALDKSPQQLPGDIVETVLSLVRPAAQLTVNGAGSPAGTYGGLPGLPVDVDWPHLEREPLSMLAQIRCAACADVLGPSWTLPCEGTMLFFYDQELRDGDEACRVLHVPDGVPVRGAPEGIGVIPALPLTVSQCLSAPEMSAPELEPCFATDPLGILAVLAELRTVLPHVPHQILGWLGEG